jgi:hypothetical protein
MFWHQINPNPPRRLASGWKRNVGSAGRATVADHDLDVAVGDVRGGDRFTWRGGCLRRNVGSLGRRRRQSFRRRRDSGGRSGSRSRRFRLLRRDGTRAETAHGHHRAKDDRRAHGSYPHALLVRSAPHGVPGNLRSRSSLGNRTAIVLPSLKPCGAETTLPVRGRTEHLVDFETIQPRTMHCSDDAVSPSHLLQARSGRGRNSQCGCFFIDWVWPVRRPRQPGRPR